MNLWACMLAESPALLQRLIARTQRVSLPRSCDTATRIMRLRQALCRQATVRAVYALLEDNVRTALQDLRHCRGGVSPEELTTRYGPVRSLRDLAADPQPRSMSEQLLLLGWLLPRPSAPHHPPRYLLPPELRRWLPCPLNVPTHGHPPVAPIPLASHAARVLLLTLAEKTLTSSSLPVCIDGTIRATGIRLLATRLNLTLAEAAPLLNFVLPLLCQLGLVAVVDEHALLMPAGQRFLSLPCADQLDRLRKAWIAQSMPDTWLRTHLIDDHGIDWPLLRRRLVSWAEQLPDKALIDPIGLYERLAAAFGPLADAQTHGFRYVDRAPWQPRRAAAVWNAALQGPLTWLGWVAWDRNKMIEQSEEHTFFWRTASPVCANAHSTTLQWRYGRPGQLLVQIKALDGDLLRLLPFADWHDPCGQNACFMLTPATLSRAASQGWSIDVLHALLDNRAGPAPTGWWQGLEHPSAVAHVEYTAVLTVEPPEILARAARSRSVRRYVRARPAPGIALVDAEQLPALTRALQRESLAVSIDVAPAAVPPSDLMPGERAALLLACAFYRQYAPPDAPLLLDDQVEHRLAMNVPPSLRAVVTAARTQLKTWHVVPAEPAGETLSPADDAGFCWFPAGCMPGVAYDVADARAASEYEPVSWPITDKLVAPPVRGDDEEPCAGSSTPALPVTATVRMLGEALRRRRLVVMGYQDRLGQRSSGRVIRPLDLERHGEIWYLRAYCVASRAERTFRVDRILELLPHTSSPGIPVPARLPSQIRQQRNRQCAPPVPI